MDIVASTGPRKDVVDWDESDDEAQEKSSGQKWNDWKAATQSARHISANWKVLAVCAHDIEQERHEN